VHLTWITNRQQGKTTTLAKFLAAMAMISPMGGPLIYVYSTTRDRAVELVDGAKRYINWILNNKENVDLLTSWGLQVKTYTANNTIGFALPSFIDNRIINNIKARPKTADSCRGDAPRACMFDEVAFVSVSRAPWPISAVGTHSHFLLGRRTFGSSLRIL
jgi:phage terminase large subunit-like protein